MATSYIDYNNFGFWLNDRFLAATLYLIQKNLKNETDKSDFLNRIIAELYDASTVGYVGCIPNNIQEFDNTKKRNYLKNALSKSIEQIINSPKELVDEFNNIQVGGFVWQEMPKPEMIGTIKLLIKLINGEIRTNAASKIDYLNFE